MQTKSTTTKKMEQLPILNICQIVEYTWQHSGHTFHVNDCVCDESTNKYKTNMQSCSFQLKQIYIYRERVWRWVNKKNFHCVICAIPDINQMKMKEVYRVLLVVSQIYVGVVTNKIDLNTCFETIWTGKWNVSNSRVGRRWF